LEGSCLARRFLLEFLRAGDEGRRFVCFGGADNGGEGVGVEVVFELLELDLGFVAETSLFLGEMVVGFESSGFNVGIECLLHLCFGGIEGSLKSSRRRCEFGVEGGLEVSRAGGDFGIEVLAMSVDAFLNNFVELLIDGIFAGLVSEA
jgi:hypothetical protein